METAVVPSAPVLAPPPLVRAQHKASESSLMMRIGPLVALSFLQAASFGIMGPMLPIAMTEVRVLPPSLALVGGLHAKPNHEHLVVCVAQYFARIYTQGVPIDCGRSPHLPVRGFSWSQYGGLPIVVSLATTADCRRRVSTGPKRLRGYPGIVVKWH
jgi:hypothetical protein